MTDCIIRWDCGRAIIKDAKLGDPRVADLLDLLARNGAQGLSMEFVDTLQSIRVPEYIQESGTAYGHTRRADV